MQRNVEIKARVPDISEVFSKVVAMATDGPSEIHQDDIFFQCRSGRLKIRTFADGTGELIFYRRADVKGPKESAYVLSPTSSPESLREALSSAYGEAGRIRKLRTLFLVGRTRVHLDRVEGLGHFVELEVVLAKGEPSPTGVQEAYRLLERLGIHQSQLLEGAYLDLLPNSER